MIWSGRPWPRRDEDSIDIWARVHHERVRLGDPVGAARCALRLGTELPLMGEMARGGGWLARAGRGTPGGRPGLLAKWIKEFRSDQTCASRKSGSIIIYDFEGTPVTSYAIVNAWPKKLTIGTLKAGDTSVLIETLLVECESIDVD